MKKPLKLAAIIVGSLVLLLIVALVVLTLVFDPNQYRDTIIQAVKAQTGRDLKIEKRIGWSVFPRLAVKTGGLELSNAPGFGKEPFARIDDAGVALQLWPLLSGTIAVDTFYLHGLVLNLAKDAGGRNNWADMVKETKAEPAPAPKAGKPALPVAGISLGRIEIRSANINWRDAAAGSTIQVKNAELTTSRFAANQPFDLKAGLELVRDRAAPIKTAIASRVTVGEDALTLDKLDLRVDDNRLTGRIDVRHLAQPALRFELATDKLDLDKLMAATSGPAPAAGASAPTGAQQPVEIPIATLRSLDVQGRLRIAALKAMNLNATEVQLPIIAKDGLITLGPSSAKLYGGSYQGTTSLDARGKVLALNINEAVNTVNLAPLLKDMYGINAFHGRATANARLTARGNDAMAVRSSLTGNALITVQDGTIKGVDLKKMADSAEEAIKSRGKDLGALGALVPAAGDETRFTRLGGTVQVTNGIARNNDLALESPSLVRVQGKGSADLVKETLDYRVTIGTVPILIKGPFAKLTYTPDVEAMATRAVERQIEKKLKERFKLP